MLTFLLLTYLASLSIQEDDRLSPSPTNGGVEELAGKFPRVTENGPLSTNGSIVEGVFTRVNESLEWTSEDRHWDINPLSLTEETKKADNDTDVNDLEEAIKNALDELKNKNESDSLHDIDLNRTTKNVTNQTAFKEVEINKTKVETLNTTVVNDDSLVDKFEVDINKTVLETLNKTIARNDSSADRSDLNTNKTELENLNNTSVHNNSSVDQTVVDTESTNSTRDKVPIDKGRNRLDGDKHVNLHDHSKDGHGISEQHHKIPSKLPVQNDKGGKKNKHKDTPNEKLPQIISVKVPQQKPEQTIAIKSRKSGVVRVEIVPDRQTQLVDHDNKNIVVKVPLFRSTVLSTGRHSFTFHMSHGPHDGVENWVMVVVKLRKDKFGRPLFLKGSPNEYKGKFLRYEDSPGLDVPYITAGFPADRAPYKFTVGDGAKYQGYSNGELESEESYAVFMAGIVHGFVGGVVYVESGWLVDAHAPDVPTYFHTNSHPSFIWPIVILVFCSGALAGIWWYFKKKGNLQPLVEKMRQNARRKTRLGTVYKFGGSKKDKQKPGSSNKKAGDVVDSFYEFGNKSSNSKLKRPRKPKKNKHKRTAGANNSGGNNGIAWNDTPHVALSSQGSHLRRHFASDYELEETVVSMSHSSDGGRYW